MSEQIETTTPLRQLCVHLSCAICSHSSVAEHFQDVSLISHNGKLLGIKLHMNVPQIEHVDIDFKSCYAFQLRHFVTSPADHFPHSLCIHCPCQWHELLIRTFLDENVFTPCKATPVQTVQQIRNSVPEWIFRHYAWGLDFSAKLSTGCSKRPDPLSTIAHRGRGSWAKPLVLHYWKYSTLFILTF